MHLLGLGMGGAAGRAQLLSTSFLPHDAPDMQAVAGGVPSRIPPGLCLGVTEADSAHFSLSLHFCCDNLTFPQAAWRNPA